MKPILFNTDMVLAILDGRKTVTMRVVKTPTGNVEKWFKQGILKPPYQPGDVLYVRETWAPIYPDKESNEVCGYIYKEDSLEEYDKRYPDGEDYQWGGKWHPSIHMPKEAARIFLKVKDVRVERLQEITADGIRNEGLSSMAVHVGDMSIALEEWKILWNSTIKKSYLDRYGWDANLWVWVIEFERCEKPEEGDGET